MTTPKRQILSSFFTKLKCFIYLVFHTGRNLRRNVDIQTELDIQSWPLTTLEILNSHRRFSFKNFLFLFVYCNVCFSILIAYFILGYLVDVMDASFVPLYVFMEIHRGKFILGMSVTYDSSVYRGE